MIFNELKKLDKEIRESNVQGCVMTNIAANVRSCGCRLLTLNFDGLILETWNKNNEKFLNIIDKTSFDWNIIYLNSFPGTDIINRITFRKLCDHCLENFKLDGVMGMGSIVFKESRNLPLRKLGNQEN
ncbi:MAG: DUF5402 family protein [Candidatus Eremiobacteraeota bacterium]|nr:DUF5402 family protein [Candidatus Eremiobacteraeota bacterium]